MFKIELILASNRFCSYPQIHCSFRVPIFHDFLFPRMNELVMRFEPPDSKNRWDSPLFTIQARYSSFIVCEVINQSRNAKLRILPQTDAW